MNRPIMTLITLAGAIALFGCGSPSTPATKPATVVKVEMAVPGASQDDIDLRVSAPIIIRAATVPGVDGVVTVAGAGQFTCYVRTSLGETGARALLAAVDKEVTAAAKSPTFASAGTTMPTITPRILPELRTTVNRDKAAQLGVDVKDIAEAIRTAGSAKAIENAQVKSSNGKTVRLLDLVEVHEVMAPDVIVRTWP